MLAVPFRRVMDVDVRELLFGESVDLLEGQDVRLAEDLGIWWPTPVRCSAAPAVPRVGYICSRARRMLAGVEVITSMSSPVLALRSSTTGV